MIKKKPTKDTTLFISNNIKETPEKVLATFREQIKNGVSFDILTPVYFDPRGDIFYHGGGFTLNEHLPHPEAQAEPDINQYPKPRQVDFSPLWVFCIKDKALEKLSLPQKMGKNIYIHADFCVRALKAGFKITVSPKIKLTYTRVYGIAKERDSWIKKLRRARKIFNHNHGKFLDSRYRLPTVFHSHSGFPGGYCLHARSLIKKLVEKKIKIHYKFIGGCNDDEPLADDFLVDDLRNNMGSMKLPQVTLSTGLNCFANSGKYKIAFTTTEVDGIPKDWVRVLNEMNEVWTTSEFAKKAFEKSGVKPLIFNMREGVDPNYFHPQAKPAKNETKKKFLFISNFAWGRRKGHDILVKAFSQEFSYTEDVALVLKVLPSYHKADIKKDLANMYYRPDGAPIIVWDAVIPPYLLPGFYRAGHCLVFPTRGEGFGLPPIEALACGVPVIVTGYSGQMDYLAPQGKPLPGVELIDYKIEKFDGSDSIYYHGFNWAKPSVNHLRQLMRKVYNNYSKYKTDALETSKYIRKEWSWDKVADLVINRLEKINAKL